MPRGIIATHQRSLKSFFRQTATSKPFSAAMGASVSSAVQVDNVRVGAGMAWTKGKTALNGSVTCGDVTFDVTAEGTTKTVSMKLQSTQTTLTYSTESIKNLAGTADQAVLKACSAIELVQDKVLLREVLHEENSSVERASSELAAVVTKEVEGPWTPIDISGDLEYRVVTELQLQVVICCEAKTPQKPQLMMQTSLKLSGTVQLCIEVRERRQPKGPQDEDSFVVALTTAVFPLAAVAVNMLRGQKHP